MKKEVAMNDLRCKIEHFKDQYEGLSRRHESHLSYIQVINDGDDVTAHKVLGPLPSKILYYISNFRPTPKTLYFSRVGLPHLFALLHTFYLIQSWKKAYRKAKHCS